MGEKQKPSHSSRIQTPSIPELADGVTLARVRLNRARVKHRGRKLKDGPLINGLVAWFLARTETEQTAIVAEGLRRFEAMLEGESPDQVEGEWTEALEPLGPPRVDTVTPDQMKVDGDHKGPKKHRRPPRSA